MMSNKTVSSQLLRDLQSDDLTVLIPAMDESVALVREFSVRVLESSGDPDYGPFVAERFHKLIATAIEETERFVATTVDAEAKVNAAVALLLLGSKAGVACLLEALESDHPRSVWIAHKLANAGIDQAKDALIVRLRRIELSRTEEIESFLLALSKLQGDLPPDLEQRFLAEDAPAGVRSLIQAEWLHQPIPAGQPSSGDLLRA